jgi:hypothetical protein
MAIDEPQRLDLMDLLDQAQAEQQRLKRALRDVRARLVAGIHPSHVKYLPICEREALAIIDRALGEPAEVGK